MRKKTHLVIDRRSGIDRRTGEDRRTLHDLDYFFEGGVERRTWMERRSPGEKREGWMRMRDWCSIYIQDLRP
jgi:hypothetical protein